jgi:iron-sulfur cluster repair protein YtfE (RIC family)
MDYDAFCRHLAKALREFGNMPEGAQPPQNAITLWKAINHGLERVATALENKGH